MPEYKQIPLFDLEPEGLDRSKNLSLRDPKPKGKATMDLPWKKLRPLDIDMGSRVRYVSPWDPGLTIICIVTGKEKLTYWLQSEPKEPLDVRFKSSHYHIYSVEEE